MYAFPVGFDKIFKPLCLTVLQFPVRKRIYSLTISPIEGLVRETGSQAISHIM